MLECELRAVKRLGLKANTLQLYYTTPKGIFIPFLFNDLKCVYCFLEIIVVYETNKDHT
jgi:hypothetical protein